MRQVSSQWRVALSPPNLHVGSRTRNATRWITDIRASIERYPGFGRPTAPDAAHDLGASVRSLFWYHTIELPGGIVTPGLFDHRPLLPFYGIPDDLQGRRVLDIGTWDGFWAFEFERRGAQVTAMDLEGLSDVDLPLAYRQALEDSGLRQYYGNGFELARNALDSNVKRVQLSVYDLEPARTGTFDVVHMGDVLLHLECPTRALRRIHSVTERTALIANPFDPGLEGTEARYQGGWWDIVWWNMSLDALGQMILDAGFSAVTVRAVYEGRTSQDEKRYWWAVLQADR